MKLIRPFIYIFAIVLGILVGIPGYAEVYGKNQYVKPQLRYLSDTSLAMGIVSLDDAPVFIEYVRLKYCDLYKKIKDDQFQWQVLHKAFLSEKENLIDGIERNFFRIPVSVKVSGYNFSTKAYDIVEGSQMRNIGVLQMYRESLYSECFIENQDNYYRVYREIPTEYLLQLPSQLSLYRIPLGKEAARRVYQELNDNTVYLDIFVTVQAAQKEIEKDDDRKIVTFFGDINRIQFYANAKRTSPFKTLYFR